MVAQQILVSTKPFAGVLAHEAREAPLPRLHHDAGELRPREIERCGRISVEPNTSL